MSAVIVLTPILAPMVISAWPAIAAAVVGAATAMGMAVKEGVNTKVSSEAAVKGQERNSVEVEVTQSEVLQNVTTGQEIVITKGNIELRVRRDERGRCSVCASGTGHTKAELKALADQFSQKMTQCFVYNRVMTELKTKGFQLVNEEQMADETVRLHVRRWES